MLPNTPETGDEVNGKLREEFRFASHAPVLFTSAVSGRRLHRLLDLVSQVHRRRQSRFSTTVLNRIIGGIVMVVSAFGLVFTLMGESLY